MFWMEQLLMRLMNLDIKIQFINKNEQHYRVVMEYRNIKAGVNIPKGEFKEGIYKALTKMADELVIKGEKT